MAHIVRDWSELGTPLRESLYGWCLEQIQYYIPPVQPSPHASSSSSSHRRKTTSLLSVLVPGAGLGRLAWELARLGYAVEANEAPLSTLHLLVLIIMIRIITIVTIPTTAIMMITFIIMTIIIIYHPIVIKDKTSFILFY